MAMQDGGSDDGWTRKRERSFEFHAFLHKSPTVQCSDSPSFPDFDILVLALVTFVFVH